MRGSVESDGYRAVAETQDGAVYLSLSTTAGRPLASSSFSPDGQGDQWSVFGTWDSGEPVALITVPGHHPEARLSPSWPGGIWAELIAAASSQEALRLAVAVKVSQGPPGYPDQPQEVPRPRSA